MISPGESSPTRHILPSPQRAGRSPSRPRVSDLESSHPQDRGGAASPVFPRKPIPPNHHTDASNLGRKISLIRPERRRYDENDPQYYYRKHALNMDVIPSTTGNDPVMIENADMHTPDSLEQEFEALNPTESTVLDEKPQNPKVERGRSRRLQRNPTVKSATKITLAEAKQRKQIKDSQQAPSLWSAYYHIITFWCPDMLLRRFGKNEKAQQRAWREKMGLISIILVICTLVGFLTFGFTQVVCPNGGPLRLQVNHVGPGYMIFHGMAYDLTRSHHPYAKGIPSGANILYLADGPRYGGQDGSFLFQNVNGACKNLITLAPGSDVPSDSSGNLAWYFPCNTFSQDGSTVPNLTSEYYFGYGCHTSTTARNSFYSGLRAAGDVYFTWDDIKNSSRNLMVYNGDVLDLNLLKWFNTSQVQYPARFTQIMNNPAVRGVDVTYAFSTSSDRKVAECFQEIIKVGSIDTEYVGCIASKVVLYVSLVFILSIVLTKFVLALLFSWVLSRKYAADKSFLNKDSNRNAEIEAWTDDIYRPPPKLQDAAGFNINDRGNRRSSFLPTTSRFTSPYAIDKSSTKVRAVPTTMASQNTNSRIASSGIYSQGSDSTLVGPDLPYAREESRTSLIGSQPSDRRFSSPLATQSQTQGHINDAVVPQPPHEWQPFGYPLAHVICLVTAYSEGPDGIRTTLDSIVTTEYPNSHKIIFMICDGLVQGKGEAMSTPEACLSMMKDHTILPDDVQPFSYVAVASGSKRHNMAKIYSGFYDYGQDSMIPIEKQQRVPMIVVVKCGNADEEGKSKPGNRGKRDSQIILMSFLQKVMFDERMTELEYEIFNGIYKVTGISPDFYEIVLMVDADTKVFPDSLTHMVSAMVKDPEIMGLCGETKIANKRASWVSMIQVFEYFISHHLSKAFESVFGGVTCLPGCFCMYRIKAPKGGQNYWVPILANPDVVEHYSENVVDTLHKKNLLLLGEDRFLSTLMLRTFPKRKQVFVPQAVCKTTVPEQFSVLLSQRRRWINSTVHNLMELVLVRDLCGTFCFSMQFVVFIELLGTLVLPAAISFTVYLIVRAIVDGVKHLPIPVIPLVLLSLILGLPAVLIVLTAHRFSYIGWMLVYLASLPVWNFILPVYAYWKFDDFSWGDTRQTAGDIVNKSGHEAEGEFDSSKITMKRWADFESERRQRGSTWYPPSYYTNGRAGSTTYDSFYAANGNSVGDGKSNVQVHATSGSLLGQESHDY